MDSYQVFNTRNGRWIHFEKGLIKETSKMKFPNIPIKVKKGKKSSQAGKKKSPMQKKTAAQHVPPFNGWPQLWLWEWI